MLYCMNAKVAGYGGGCERPLDADHIVLVTTAHVRRFCSMECLNASWARSIRILAETAHDGPVMVSCSHCGRRVALRWDGLPTRHRMAGGIWCVSTPPWQGPEA